MSTSYSDVCLDVNYVHQASENFHPKNHRFYRSSLDLFGLLLFFHKRGGFYGKTKYLALKMGVSERAIYKALDLLQEHNYITRTKEGKKRLITCLVTSLPPLPKKQKVQSSAKRKVQSLPLEKKELIHNTRDVDVLDVLQGLGMKPAVARDVASKFSRDRIRAAINQCKRQGNIKNQSGWVLKCLSSQWKIPTYEEEPPKYKEFVKPKEICDRSRYVTEIQKIKMRLGILK